MTGDLEGFFELAVEVHLHKIVGCKPTGILGQLFADRTGSLDRLDDLLGMFADVRWILFFKNGLGKTEYKLERVIDVVSNARNEGTDPSQFLNLI